MKPPTAEELRGVVDTETDERSNQGFEPDEVGPVGSVSDPSD